MTADEILSRLTARVDSWQEGAVSSPPMFPDLSPTQSVELSVQQLGWNMRSASDAAAALEGPDVNGLSATEAIGDLVTHCRHLADREHIRWSTVTWSAERHYYAQTQGERPPTHLGWPHPSSPCLPEMVAYARDEEEVRRANRRRADKATAAIARFSPSYESDLESGMVDLVTGLRHLAEALPGVFWGEIEEAAERHYHAEIRGES